MNWAFYNRKSEQKCIHTKHIDGRDIKQKPAQQEKTLFQKKLDFT